MRSSVGGSGEGHGGDASSGVPVRDPFARSVPQSLGKLGQLERPPGFTRSVIDESGLSQIVPVTDAMRSLRGAEELSFDEPESVCGNDDRTRISPTINAPWRWICELFITFPNGVTGRGTGWFFGPRSVGTAGHVVYNADAGGWASRIEVIPGLDDDHRPFGSQVGTSFRSTNAWVRSADKTYDYGAIILPDDSLGRSVGHFGLAEVRDEEIVDLFVNTAGYPSDQAFGTQWFNGGSVAQATASTFLYMLDTVGGQSGSAIWQVADGQHAVVGVHGYGGCPNKAVRFNDEVFANFTAWRDE